MSMQHRRAMELLLRARVYFPALVPRVDGAEPWLLYSGTRLYGEGATVEAAYNDALAEGLIVRPEPMVTFRGHGTEVLQGADIVAYARSRTMADRIANALNQYVPNDRKS